MKYFIAIALFAAVASAAIVRPTPISAEAAEIQEIIAAIQSPSTHPATAAALEQMLEDLLGVKPEGIAVGPAIIENPLEGIAVGPAIIPFPLPDGGVVAEEPIVAPSPVAIVEGPAPEASASSPLVQIIVNVNQAAAEASPVALVPVAPVIVPEYQPAPVRPDPVQVVEVAPEPVQVVEVAPTPIHVVDTAPVPVEPVLIGVPVLPSPAVVLPEELN